MSAYIRCNMLLAKGQYREAKELALTELSQSPNDANLLSAIARSYRGLNDPVQALSFAQRAVAAEPHDAEFLAELAYMQDLCGAGDAALETVRSALSIDPNNHFVIMIAVSLLTHARRSRRARDRAMVEEARTVVDGGVIAHPDSSSMHVADGRVHMAQRQYAGAEVSARHALEIDPHNASAMMLLADATAKQGRTHEAGDVYVQAAKADPTSDNALAGLREISSGRLVFLVVVLGLVFVILASLGGPSIIVMPLIMAGAIGSIVFLGDALTNRAEKKTAARKLSPNAQSILDQDRRLR